MRLTLSHAALAATLTLSACAGAENDPPAIQSRVALSPIGSCSELEQYIEDTAVEEMRVSMESYLHGGFWGRGGILESADANAASAPGAKSSGPTNYTKTNTQVEGVDEADFMKTDGKRIFVLSSGKLYIAKSWPANELAIQNRLTIQGYAREMFLDENGRLVIFSAYSPSIPANDRYHCGYWGCGRGDDFVKITVVDVSGEAPRVTRELYSPGYYVSSRRIGDSVRLVTRNYFHGPDGVRYWPENFQGNYEDNKDEFEAALRQQIARNETIIRGQSLDDWLPEGYERLAAGTQSPLVRDCTQFHRTNASVRLGLATIATIKLSGSRASMSQTSILGEVGQIYASQESLYLANPHWWWWSRPGQQNYTYLHNFDIRNPQFATYVGSGAVPGNTLNQFSMDEHQGYLRVATTLNRWVEDGDNEWGRVETTNQIHVLAERSGRLNIVGQTPELAEGESIRSARFMGNKGYVVTFEQIDPLFTLDLSRPTNPRVIGELKIPGFSSYLHPLGEDHLLAMGIHLPEPDSEGRVDWSQRRVKLTIFDVSDFENPREKFTHEIGTAHGWSEALWSHKAFNYFAEKKTLAVPFFDHRPNYRSDYWNSFTSELRIYSVDTQTGFRPVGAISMSDLYRQHSYRDWTWYWSPMVRRSVMADDFAYAISDAGIRAIDMRNPSQVLATTLFDGITRGN